MKTDSLTDKRPRYRACIAVAALAVVGSSPVLASDTRQAAPAAADNVAGIPVVRDGRGNWMREFVQLRLAEHRLALSGETAERQLWQEQMVGPPSTGPAIVGGSVAGASDNPFQVALLTRNISSNFNAQFCGGTLVAPNKIVTAAHCSDFVTAGQVQVLTGTRRLDGTGVRRNVTRIDIHPSWNDGTMDYDVAVWTLSTSTSGIPFATLASADPAVGTSLLVTGWGSLSSGGSYPIELRKVSVPLVSRTNCNDSNSYNGQITTRMLCAGYDAGGKDSRQGDSGGPLARGSVLTGIVSWGDGCAARNKHGIYTRVSNSSIRSFIRSKAGI